MEKTIANVVGQSFVRSCKEHNYYTIFKKGAYTKKHKYLYNNVKGQDVRGIWALFKSFYEEVRKNLRQNSNKYEETTLMTNFLIKSYLENGGVHPKYLEAFGREVYNRSCCVLFGDEFKKRQEEEEKIMKSFKDDFQKFAYTHYMGLKECHVINSNMTFEQFLTDHGNKIRQMYDMKGNMEMPFPGEMHVPHEPIRDVYEEEDDDPYYEVEEDDDDIF